MYLDSLKGQSGATSFLKGLVSTTRYPKALVFHGPEGVGKACYARAFSLDVLNHGQDPDSALERLVDTSNHSDFHWVVPEDGYTDKELGSRKTSPTWRVAHVRRVLQDLESAPVFGHHRIVVFDHFDRMPAASGLTLTDAFLKVLEEGYPETTFILITRSLADLPGTLQSRCIPLQFFPLPDQDLQDLLSEYSGQPHFELCCELARGSLSQAQRYLNPKEDQLDFENLRLRALRLFSNLSSMSSGVMFHFLEALPDQSVVDFHDMLMYVYLDLFKMDQGLDDLTHHDCMTELLKIQRKNSGSWYKIYTPLQDFYSVRERSGVNMKHQLKACLLRAKKALR